jgi:pyruvate-formate lyase-activating enzyme
MPEFNSIESAIDPNNRISFLLDWELTMKCNLNCSYCPTGIYGGHDNSTNHPPVDQCVETIDFMYRYADLYMQHKPPGIQYVMLNVYGGESLHHPDIVKILQQVHEQYQPYQDRWSLTVTTTTNAIVNSKKLKSILPYIDEFTVSYHAENNHKQKQQFKENILTISQSGKRLKCIVMMHTDAELFADCKQMIEWLTQNNIKFLAKQIDSQQLDVSVYDQKQIHWFNSFYKNKTYQTVDTIETTQDQVDLSDTGRACCGGRQLCLDQNYSKRNYYILDNKFSDWYCSVNWFFLHIKQVNGEIYVNKDCKMNFNGETGPIGHLNSSDKLLTMLSDQLATNSVPIIQCKKTKCHCGLCAPKAKDLDTYKQINAKYQSNYQS